MTHILIFICEANGSHLFLSLSVKQMGHTYNFHVFEANGSLLWYMLVNGIYYVHVCEQACWARSAGNSTIENLYIILILFLFLSVKLMGHTYNSCLYLWRKQVTLILIFICEGNRSHLFLTLSVKETGHTYSYLYLWSKWVTLWSSPVVETPQRVRIFSPPIKKVDTPIK